MWKPLPPRAEIYSGKWGTLFLRQRWLDELAAAVDVSAIKLGGVYLDGAPHEDWRTVTTPRRFQLRGKTEGANPPCPGCGYAMVFPHTGPHFKAPEVLDYECFEARGLFVREDLVKTHGLRKPNGADRPTLVRTLLDP